MTLFFSQYLTICKPDIEIFLKLQFLTNRKEVYEKMKWFVEKLYNYEFTGIATEEDVEDEEEEVSITIHVDSEEEDGRRGGGGGG